MQLSCALLCRCQSHRRDSHRAACVSGPCRWAPSPRHRLAPPPPTFRPRPPPEAGADVINGHAAPGQFSAIAFAREPTLQGRPSSAKDFRVASCCEAFRGAPTSPFWLTSSAAQSGPPPPVRKTGGHSKRTGGHISRLGAQCENQCALLITRRSRFLPPSRYLLAELPSWRIQSPIPSASQNACD